MNTLKPHRIHAILNALLEGCSIRATARLTGADKETIMRYLVLVGEHCQSLLDRHLQNLPCRVIEADEIWTFVRKKQRRLTPLEKANPEIGDQYTFVGFDPATKLMAAHAVGRRDFDTTRLFMEQLRRRIPQRIDLYTDGFPEYLTAIERVYGFPHIDYAQVIKPVPGGLHIVRPLGKPDKSRIGTSYVERNNLTIRQQIRRFTRRTLGFSKKLRNLRAAVALYVAHYNFVRFHGSIRMPPALAAGVTDHLWNLHDLLP